MTTVGRSPASDWEWRRKALINVFFAENIFEWTREPEDEKSGRALKECESHEGEGCGWVARKKNIDANVWRIVWFFSSSAFIAGCHRHHQHYHGRHILPVTRTADPNWGQTKNGRDSIEKQPRMKKNPEEQHSHQHPPTTGFMDGHFYAALLSRCWSWRRARRGWSYLGIFSWRGWLLVVYLFSIDEKKARWIDETRRGRACRPGK